jgi:hypothetical protein
MGRGADEAFSAKSALEDTKLYFTAPLRWDEEDWVAFGGALVAIGAAHQFDAKVRDHFATGSKAILNGGEDNNSSRDAAPTVALLAGTGLPDATTSPNQWRQGGKILTTGSMAWTRPSSW